MSSLGHTPVTPQPPPELPHSPEIGPALSRHLRTLALWAKNDLSNKLDTRTAQPGLLLHANDAPAGTTPAVFSLEVKSDGTLVAVPIALAARRRMA
jgi:hypothetical protein